MPVWQVALLLNLTLAIALGLGYVGWGRPATTLAQELDSARARIERLERERAACNPGVRTGEQQWEGRGVVRAVYPQLLVITHEEIRGLLPARTTSFRRSSPAPANPLQVGDPIRFSLRGTVVDDVALVATEPW